MSLNDVFSQIAGGLMNTGDLLPVAGAGAKNLDDIAALAMGSKDNKLHLSTKYTNQLATKHKWTEPISEKLVPLITQSNYPAILRTSEEIALLPVPVSQKQKLLLHYAQRGAK